MAVAPRSKKQITPTKANTRAAPAKEERREAAAAAIQRAMGNPAALSSADVLSLQRSLGNRATQRVLAQNGAQAKLTVGAADDPYEREADQVAERVMRAGLAPASAAGDPRAEDLLQAKPGSIRDSFEVDGDFEQSLSAARSGGARLPDSTRGQMEAGIGADFGGVRVHTDGQSDALSRSIGAKAFTSGSDIFFGQGQYQPNTTAGGELIAHELTHTVQQGAAGLQRATAHAAGCSCPACAGKSADAPSISRETLPDSVQRKLDDQYTSANIRLAGHKPSYFFFKSTFAKLLDALDVYYAATTSEAQYGALTTVQARIADYWKSGAREETKKGQYKVKEDAKQDLVRHLETDVKSEIATLNQTPSANLLNAQMANGPETVVMVVSNNLARALKVETSALLNIQPDTLRSRFITEVYLPEYMAERGGLKLPNTMSVAEQLDHIRQVNRIDPTKLGVDSEASRLFALLERADLGKGVKNVSDPKFGGEDVEDYVPDVEGWNKANALAIKGGTDYRGKVKSMVGIIARTAVGKRLLSGIGGESGAESKGVNSVHPENKNRIAKINPPSLANVNFKDQESGQFMYANSAGKGAATVDAFNEIIGNDPTKTGEEPFRQRDAVIGLFHELVHVYLGQVTEPPFQSLEDKSVTKQVGLMFEPRVAGIRIQEKKDGNTYTYPFDDPKYNYVSENTFRKEYAALKGETEYYARPYYDLKDTTEVMGPTEKQRV